MRRLVTVLLAAPVLMAATLTDEQAAKAFGAREGMTGVELSPDGKTLLYLSAVGDRGTTVNVVPLDTLTARPPISSSGDPETLRWCGFAGTRRMVCQLTIKAEDVGVKFGMSRLLATDLDGQNVKLLGQRKSDYDERVRQFDGAILDWLPNANGEVLMARDYVPEAGKIGTLVVRRADGLGVDRVDTTTGRGQRVQSPQKNAVQYITDGEGHVRLMALGSTRGATGRTGANVFWRYQPADGSEWRDFGRYDLATDEGIIPLAVDAERNAAYVLKKLNGRRALYRVALDNGLSTELVYANPDVDVDDVVRSGLGNRVIGVSFADERRRVVYFDEEAERLTRQLSAALPNLPLIDIVGSDRTGGKLIVHAASDDDPGRYYLFDRATRVQTQSAA